MDSFASYLGQQGPQAPQLPQMPQMPQMPGQMPQMPMGPRTDSAPPQGGMPMGQGQGGYGALMMQILQAIAANPGYQQAQGLMQQHGMQDPLAQMRGGMSGQMSGQMPGGPPMGGQLGGGGSDPLYQAGLRAAQMMSRR
jgi:hypothetical protein